MNISATLLLSFRRLLFLSLFLLLSFSVSAQDFQWVKGGGTSAALSLSWWLESTRHMCTDPHGNVYVMSNVGFGPVTADTFYSSGYTKDRQILVTSYDCNGQMRWAKLIASTTSSIALDGIQADTLGNIYVAGNFHYSTPGFLHIGGDTVLGTTSWLDRQFHNAGVIQFDTSGHFNWIRFIGASIMNTAGLYSSLYNAIEVDGEQNLHYIKLLRSGAVLAPGDTSKRGYYDFTYNAAGDLLSTKKINLDSSLIVSTATIDKSSGKLYVWGSRNLDIMPDSFISFVASFDLDRNKIWMDTLDNYKAGLAGITADGQGHLYFCGKAQSAEFPSATTFTFRGMTVTNNLTPGYYDISVVMKTDTAGNPVWISKLDATTNVNNIPGITLMPGGKIGTSGFFAGKITNGTDSLVSTAGEGQNPFIQILDTSGNILKLVEVHGNGFYDWGRCAASDHKGNLYIGGNVEYQIWGSEGITPYTTQGGPTDFFVMKYGYSCDCDSTPVASFTYSGSDATSFSYTGTTDIDSLHWDFGDGTFSNDTNPTHTYTAAGSYNVCLTIYSECGNNTVCATIESTVSVGNVAVLFPDVNVYPNPASNSITVEGAGSGTRLSLYSITGALQLEQTLRNSLPAHINISHLPDGVYLLQLTDVRGKRGMTKIVKR